MKYEKKPITIDEQINLLVERKLFVSDIDRAKRYLSTIGYFRLTGYMYHLQEKDGSHRFKEGVCFNDIIVHYQFDKKLRTILSDYLERIEIALRSKLTYYYCINHGFYWYTKYDLYTNKHVYNSINKEIKNSYEKPQERFLKFFKQKYTFETLPPSNMAMETLTLGKLARLYKGLRNNDQKNAVAEDFGLPVTILSSWIIYLNEVRNICAHHGGYGTEVLQ
ncbi:Abi family protein [Aquimarina sp. ERC-38]|uniref:Abi family protein n=1 Tax=Aquimarina sp. ERC-38 TaxID=2949996 RepID=UPI0022456C9B|nr:Abi family protein [Aquimarina sp. ERC-38]UZO82269.1 Abi family protein [Aquimarina sp. ERC-38]